jgi:hypothetical protein
MVMMLTIRAWLPARHHVAHRRLHEEERRPQVDRHVGVEELRGGVDQRAAAGESRRVDQAVDPAEATDHLGHRALRLRDVGDVGLHEHRLAAAAIGELGGAGTADIRPAPRDDDGGALVDRGPGDRGAHPLGAAADQQDLALEQAGHEVVRRAA